MKGFPRAHGESPTRGARKQGHFRRLKLLQDFDAEAERLARRRAKAKPPKEGLNAALAEYRAAKAAGLVAVWRDRWRAILHYGRG